MTQATIDKLLTKGKEGSKALIVGVYTGKEVGPFVDESWVVTGSDLLPPYRDDYKHVRGQFQVANVGRDHDVVLCSHMLEHVDNVGVVLRKLSFVLKPGGYLGLVVPGYPQEALWVGHLTLWTPALLLYNLVYSGWNCKRAEYRTSDDHKNIELVVPNERFDWPKDLDRGHESIGYLQQYLPVPMGHCMNAWMADHWDYEVLD